MQSQHEVWASRNRAYTRKELGTRLAINEEDIRTLDGSSTIDLRGRDAIGQRGLGKARNEAQLSNSGFRGGKCTNVQGVRTRPNNVVMSLSAK